MALGIASDKLNVVIVSIWLLFLQLKRILITKNKTKRLVPSKPNSQRIVMQTKHIIENRICISEINVLKGLRKCNQHEHILYNHVLIFTIGRLFSPCSFIP